MIKPKHTHIKNEFSAEEYVQGLADGNISMLGRAITLVESTKEEHQKLSQQILEQCLPMTGNSVRIGITGVP